MYTHRERCSRSDKQERLHCSNTAMSFERAGVSKPLERHRV